ncbi:MAG TPA: hypothetical protein VGN20_15005 [Mucilaginibacter sp.]|jgi:hypothetical protein
MEVHHHPAVPHGEKKRFKEYLLEFIMIFLAVTMGFIAENIREHVSDSSKENEYIAGMIKNLEVDTAEITKTIGRNTLQLSGIDSLRSISKDKLDQIQVQDSLYRLTNKYLFNVNVFQNDDVTLSQLRNSGGYRFIRNTRVLDSIEVYEKNLNVLNVQFNYLLASFTKAIDMSGSLFDLNADHKFQSAPTSTPILISNNKEKIFDFYNKCYLISVSLRGYNQMLKGHLTYSTRLIAYLQKEYDI